MAELNLPRLHETQSRTLEEAARYNVLCCGLRWGKTTMGIEVAVQALLGEGEGQPVGWWSPTYKMLSDVWRNLTNTLQPITVDKSEQEHRIKVSTGGTLDMWSLDSPDSARGRKYGVAIVDEAAMVPHLMDTFNMVIRPTLVDLAGSAWFMSTPKVGLPDFKTLHLMGRSGGGDWRSWTYSSYDNPYLPKTELDALQGDMTELAYRQEIMAEFLTSEGAVFRNLKAACTAAPGDTLKQHEGHILVAGADWGKQDDYTVISVGCSTCRREVAIERYNQIDYHLQSQRVTEMCRKWGVKSLIVELNSIGQPVFEMLQRQGLPCVGFDTTSSSKPPLIEALALALEQASPLFLSVDWGIAELEAYERKVNANTGHSSYSAPSGMHDDSVIARALMLRAMRANPVQIKRTAHSTYATSKGL